MNVQQFRGGLVSMACILVQWFRGGLVFVADMLLYHATLDSRVIKRRRRRSRLRGSTSASPLKRATLLNINVQWFSYL